MPLALKDRDGCAFGGHESGALKIEGTAEPIAMVLGGGRGAQEQQCPHGQDVQYGVRSSCEHALCLTTPEGTEAQS